MSDANNDWNEYSKWSVNYKWNQPNWQPYQFQDFGKEEQKKFDDVKRVIDTKACEAELDKIEMVDRWVNAMLTYPDAEAIMNKIRQQGECND